MSQIFKPSTNTLARVTLFGAIFFLLVSVWILVSLNRSAYATRQTIIRAQPVPFSHDHHTEAMGISCLYCHTSVEESAFAGIPPTATCMNCHKLIWNDSPMLEPVRESLRTGEPIRWARVNDLPDCVYFNHSIHIAKGMGCVSCHGRVDKMPYLCRWSGVWTVIGRRRTSSDRGVRSTTWNGRPRIKRPSEPGSSRSTRSRAY